MGRNGVTGGIGSGGGPLIAVDAMGGDHGLPVTMAGIALARRESPDLRFLLVGDSDGIAEALTRHPNLTAAAEICHADTVVGGHEKPRAALRTSKTSSMGLAIAAVKSGTAAAAVSAGNTGALVMMANVALRTLPGIGRPALTAFIPTIGDHDVVMLDVGANTECDSRNLIDFAVMGAAYARLFLGLARPRVALLNIGTEASKGTEAIKEAAAALENARDLPLDFRGFTEGDKIASGEVDVVVIDGFTGNVALKTAEGTARFVVDLLRRAFTSSVRSKLGFLVSRPATELLRHHLDPNNHNGAVLLGLNGVVVKSHGSANEKGIAQAIAVAAKLVREGLAERIRHDMAAMRPANEPLPGGV